MSSGAAIPLAVALRRSIRDVADFPREGIVFRDLTPVVGDAVLFARVLDALADPYRADGITRVVAVESRGFIFGAPVAERLGVGLVPARKLGKLPHRTVSASYDLEYGTATLQMHADAMAPGDRVLVVDDVLATGGTAAAAASLVEACGGEVAGFAFVLAIGALAGHARLGGRRIVALADV